MMTDLRAGMQIHAGTFVGPLGHNARQQRYAIRYSTWAMRCTEMASTKG